ncbi:MAG: TPR repeat protein [Candidatus Binatia bacterium]|jgi:TPR repeat protein
MKRFRRFNFAVGLFLVHACAALTWTAGCSKEPEESGLTAGERDIQEPVAMAEAMEEAGEKPAKMNRERTLAPTNAPITPEQYLIELQARAKGGDSEALFKLGQYAYAGNLSERNFTVAADYFRRASEAGHTDAMTSLGTMYGEGKGVRRSMIEAGRWFKRAAERDNPLGQVSLAQMYLRGLGNGRPDYARALHWHQRAAQLGDAMGQAGLASQHLLGQGTRKDLVRAAEWYREAADQGLASAQVNLGTLYRTGSGVARDEVEACMWFSLAARQNDPTGRKARDAFLRKFDEAQIADLDNRLKAMEPSEPASAQQ